MSRVFLISIVNYFTISEGLPEQTAARRLVKILKNKNPAISDGVLYVGGAG